MSNGTEERERRTSARAPSHSIDARRGVSLCAMTPATHRRRVPMRRTTYLLLVLAAILVISLVWVTVARARGKPAADRGVAPDRVGRSTSEPRPRRRPLRSQTHSAPHPGPTLPAGRAPSPLRPMT